MVTVAPRAPHFCVEHWTARFGLSASSSQKFLIFAFQTASTSHSPEEEAEGAGDGEDGIKSIWPACNFNGFSMRLYFCSSLTATPYILAMEVSVSPRCTV